MDSLRTCKSFVWEDISAQTSGDFPNANPVLVGDKVYFINRDSIVALNYNKNAWRQIVSLNIINSEGFRSFLVGDEMFSFPYDWEEEVLGVIIFDLVLEEVIDYVPFPETISHEHMSKGSFEIHFLQSLSSFALYFYNFQDSKHLLFTFDPRTFALKKHVLVVPQTETEVVFAASTATSDTIFVFGGREYLRTKSSNRLMLIHAIGSRFVVNFVETSLRPRFHSNIGISGNRMFIYGGRDQKPGQYIDEFDVYDMKTKRCYICEESGTELTLTANSLDAFADVLCMVVVGDRKLLLLGARFYPVVHWIRPAAL